MSAAPDVALSTRIAAIRAQLVGLASARAAGTLDATAYEAARRDAERALGDAVLASSADLTMDSTTYSTTYSTTDSTTDSPTSRPVERRPSWRLVAALGVGVLAVAIGGYAVKGSPSLAGVGQAPQAPVAGATTEPAVGSGGDSEREVGMQQIAAMVDSLAARLKDRPDDADGWVMLARSYTVLTRYRDALPAYQHAIALRPKDAGLLADYADAMAASRDGKADAESTALIDRALAIDPQQPKALALAGTIAFDRGDFTTAVRQWQTIADALPPDSEFHRQVAANIDEARRRGGLPVAATGSPGRSSSASSTIPSTSSSATAPTGPAGREALTGVVTLAPALAARAAPDDTVFVLARPQSGRMPLAVFRATVKDLPLRFRLDDSMAMTPTMKISDMKQVVVAARVSKSGNAITQPGDLSGESGPVAPGTGGLAIEIGNVAPAR